VLKLSGYEWRTKDDPEETWHEQKEEVDRCRLIGE
jgi:hypothetical protein